MSAAEIQPFARRIIAVAVAAIMLSACAGQNSLDGEISGDTFTVYTYKPDRPGKYPGLLMLHSIVGLRPHVLDYASDISKQGYVAVAFDYKGESTGRSDVGKRNRIYDALRYLASLPEVDSERIGIVGFSLGPRHALSIAHDSRTPGLASNNRLETKIKVIVSYYVGLLGYVMEKNTGFEAILFLHGDRDHKTPVEDVETFCGNVIASGRVCEMEIYPGAMHSFDTFTLLNGEANAFVTAKAFARSVRFLETYLK